MRPAVGLPPEIKEKVRFTQHDYYQCGAKCIKETTYAEMKCDIQKAKWPRNDKSVIAEISCIPDAVHLGYVHDDGPPVDEGGTGQRYTVNSASLNFVPVNKLSKVEKEFYFPELAK